MKLAQEIRNIGEWNALGIDRQAASLLQLPSLSSLAQPPGIPEPVAYADGKPEASDLNDDGECWRFNPGSRGKSSPFLVHDSWVLSCREIGTHWLPHDTPCLPSNFRVEPTPFTKAPENGKMDK